MLRSILSIVTEPEIAPKSTLKTNVDVNNPKESNFSETLVSLQQVNVTSVIPTKVFGGVFFKKDLKLVSTSTVKMFRHLPHAHKHKHKGKVYV